MNLSLLEMKDELSIRSKNGLPFLISATIIWTMITIIFIQLFAINEKNIYMLFSTGLMLPLSMMIAKILKADWKSNDNPLGDLGLYLNLAQLMYFPILFWAFVKNPYEMIIFFAVITGAHFFPFGWFYNTKAYYVLAPVISIAVTLIGWTLETASLWIIPLVMVILLLILIVWLYVDYKEKCKRLLRS